MDHGEEARRRFMMGYNCAQSVFCAFRDETGLSLDESARLSSSFGGRHGQTEGSVRRSQRSAHGSRRDLRLRRAGR